MVDTSAILILKVAAGEPLGHARLVRVSGPLAEVIEHFVDADRRVAFHLCRWDAGSCTREPGACGVAGTPYEHTGTPAMHDWACTYCDGMGVPRAHLLTWCAHDMALPNQHGRAPWGN